MRQRFFPGSINFGIVIEEQRCGFFAVEPKVGADAGSYEKGFPIRGLDEAAKIPDTKIFHAGTLLNENGEVANNGGRVLGVMGVGDSVSLAKLAAYSAVKCIRWDGAWCRKDISDKCHS